MINYDNPYIKSVMVRLLRIVKGISVGYPWPNNRGLKTNSKLIPKEHFMQVGGGARKERQVEGY